MKKKNEYTSLVGVKWTQESLLKCLEDMYKRYQNKLLENKKMRWDERELRILRMSVIFRSMYNPIKKYGVTVKKK